MLWMTSLVRRGTRYWVRSASLSMGIGQPAQLLSLPPKQKLHIFAHKCSEVIYLSFRLPPSLYSSLQLVIKVPWSPEKTYNIKK